MGGLFWQGGTNFGCLNQSGETDFGCQNWSGGPLFRKNRSGGTDFGVTVLLEYFDCSNFHWQGTTKFGWAWPAPVMAVEPLSAVQPGHAFKTALRKPIAYRSLSAPRRLTTSSYTYILAILNYLAVAVAVLSALRGLVYLIIRVKCRATQDWHGTDNLQNRPKADILYRPFNSPLYIVYLGTNYLPYDCNSVLTKDNSR